MSRYLTHNLTLMTALALALLLPAQPPAAAATGKRPDFAGFWSVRFERTPSGQAMIDQLPRDAVMINDSGAGELGQDDFAGLKLSEQAQAEIRNYNYKDELKRENTCVDPSVI
ncbi:MAG: hypothetical protein HW386_1365, partial [Gammaproteobacteria bacterium]|nr:hypothetical protein [Gammaproteobacteria bacterium]